MSTHTLVSIIINNYNYDTFLSSAIDSALNQTYSNVEVIVVDDGSTDNSKDTITSYGSRIKAIIKENGGQASAFNIGFNASQGETILFLDSDDVLLPHAAERAVEVLNSFTVSKAHWALWEINEAGQKNGRLFPSQHLKEGNLQDLMIEKGPDSYVSPPTTGNAWSRSFLEKVLPIPVNTFRICADAYLFMLAPLYGDIITIKEPLGHYRIHSNNNYKGKIWQEQKLSSLISRYDASCSILKEHLDKQGLSADIEKWKRGSWLYNLQSSIEEIKSLVKPGEAFILVDEAQWDATGEIAGRKVIPFIEHEGQYWGPPENDDVAIKEVERQRKIKATFIFFTANAFWWLNYYVGLNAYLNQHYKLILDNERLIAYDLRERSIKAAFNEYEHASVAI